ncbi:hypothetical protein L1267_12330 [Pseudoalteromonas sp. OFAV1]|jgi:precorrin-2 methylase|uniref:hypothetical protein n=1 Tax=Pseudoalteromonas sp. OFAV1 TaxID=2908892 RepID=UPI001F398FEC|nr:hypothetical protein [Pseudoalteromonas sp. OFAV1]MCF2901179.1 hypothetical protein [Pseudoalteromonas sp. OFAV1]
MKNFTITKSLKFVAAAQVFIVPFSGNFTENKALEVATKIRDRALELKMTTPKAEEIAAVLKNPWYASIEKDIAVEIDDNERASFTGQGWGSINIPKSDYSILD